MFGLDLLGLSSKRWPIIKTVRTINGVRAIGMFWATFGSGRQSRKNIKTLLDNCSSIQAVRIHPPWNNHIINTKRQVKKTAKAVNKLCKEYPNVNFYLSCGCEHDEKSEKVVRNRLAIIAKYAPVAIAVNCPSKGVMIPHLLTEKHDHIGQKQIARPYIVSNDGGEMNERQIRNYIAYHKAKAVLVFLWCNRFNFRDVGELNPPSPKNRTKAPSIELIKKMADFVI